MLFLEDIYSKEEDMLKNILPILDTDFTTVSDSGAIKDNMNNKH